MQKQFFKASSIQLLSHSILVLFNRRFTNCVKDTNCTDNSNEIKSWNYKDSSYNAVS
jgi:hypothetical protein